MIHDLLSLEDYFAQFKGQFGIADYCFGSTDDINSRKSVVIRYPCLWLELLEERIDDDDLSHFRFHLVLQQESGNQLRRKDREVLNHLRATMLKIIAKMKDDSPQYLIFYRPKATFQYKEKSTGDNELLVVVELEIGAIHVCE
jgi:hypothetical protein